MSDSPEPPSSADDAVHPNPAHSDPFGTQALREAVLRSWRDSPTRFTEDTNAERDLRIGAYRDRLFVELAQNAADAALAAGEPGRVRVRVTEGELRFANTGAPLDTAGVEALSSLRASRKREDAVGRFGVGFAAVLAVSTEPRVISRTGGVAFSARRTRQACGREGDVPVLRLPWPVDEEPPAGFTTEVRLPLRPGIDPKQLLARLTGEVGDLLLALPWLAEIDVDGVTASRSEVDGEVVVTTPGEVRRWLTLAGDGWMWAVPLGSAGPVPQTHDVLHAPTPTDERLSLPARLIASVPLESSRRRLLPGAETALAEPARGYPALLARFAPEHRLALVPGAGFPLSEVDARLRELVLAELAAQPWLPAAAGGELAGSGARVLSVDSPELVELLAEIVPGLATSCGFAAARTLAVVGAERLDPPEVIERLTGVDRPPSWWHSLYDVLLALLEAHSIDADDLGALPVPLADGRTVPGPRGALLAGASAAVDLLTRANVTGLRLVHPEAAHPLLERLGATRAEPADLLDAPALREAVAHSLADAESGLDPLPLAEAVLRLASESLSVSGLGALALPAEDGWRRADELVLPGSPILAVLDPDALGQDAPLSVLDAEFAERWPGEALGRVGVVSEFVVSGEEIRDLDLVADDAWPEALRLLAGRRETWQALAGPSGRWLARNAVLAGRAPEDWRAPDATALAGLYDPVPDVGLRPEVLAAVGVRTELRVDDPVDAMDVLERLGDRERSIAPGLTMRAYAAVADADLDWTELDPPDYVRAMDGTVIDAEQAAVLDQPWLISIRPPGRLVATLPGRAEALAELLDVPLLSEIVSARVPDDGEYVPWSELTAITLVAELLDIPVPDGGVVVHEGLTIEVDGVKHNAPWWVESGLFHGEHHAEDTPYGLARAFAWACGRWADRFLITALLEDPNPAIAFG